MLNLRQVYWVSPAALPAVTFTSPAYFIQEDPSVAARLQRLQNQYEDYGMRRTVEAILVVHEHGHPFV